MAQLEEDMANAGTATELRKEYRLVVIYVCHVTRTVRGTNG